MKEERVHSQTLVFRDLVYGRGDSVLQGGQKGLFNSYH